MVVPHTPKSSNHTPRHVLRGNEFSALKRCLLSGIHCNNIFPKASYEKDLCLWTGEWMKNVCTCEGILRNFQKEGDSATCDNMEESGGHYAE